MTGDPPPGEKRVNHKKPNRLVALGRGYCDGASLSHEGPLSQETLAIAQVLVEEEASPSEASPSEEATSCPHSLAPPLPPPPEGKMAGERESEEKEGQGRARGPESKGGL